MFNFVSIENWLDVVGWVVAVITILFWPVAFYIASRSNSAD